MVAAPLDEAQLLARADLAGIARVLSLHPPHVTLRFTTLVKGRPRGSGLLARLGLGRKAVVRLHGHTMIDMTDTGDPALVPLLIPALGGWTDEGAYRPGTIVKTHLVWDAKDEVYETLWWNAVTRVR